MLMYHVDEIKKRIIMLLISIVLTGLVLWDSKESLLLALIDKNLIFTSISEGFTSYLEFTILFSIVLNIPYILYHIYLFLEPGYYFVELYSIKKYSPDGNLFLLISVVFKKESLATICPFKYY